MPNIIHGYDFEYKPNNGIAHRGRDFRLIMEEYPVIPAAKKIYNAYTIPGRAGQLIQDTKTKENINLEIPITMLAPPMDQMEYRDYIRQINDWLQGDGWLWLSDEQDTRYKVLYIQVGGSERITPIYGKLNTMFCIEPYEYANSGFLEIDAEDLRFNGYDLCKPIYLIEGNATGYIVVNGVQFDINSIERLTIDTELMLTWTTVNGQVENQAITGNYEDLWLPRGEVTITVSPGLTVKVMPRWGWEL